MKRTAGYLRVLFKRAAVLLPYILLICILMLAGVSAFAYATKENRDSDVSKEKVRIGIVADSKHRYMKMALNAVENFDYSRMSVEFVICDEQQAKEGLDKGEFGGYLVVPEDFFDKIGIGEHHPMTYVTGDKESAFGIALQSIVLLPSLVTGSISISWPSYSMRMLAWTRAWNFTVLPLLVLNTSTS